MSKNNNQGDIFDFTNSKNNFNDLIKKIKDNNLDILDNKLTNQIMDNNTLIYEVHFFNSIKNALKNEYNLDNVYLLFADMESNFNVKCCKSGNDYLIIYSCMFFNFINIICLYILSYYEFSSAQSCSDEDLNKIKNYIIGIIDIMINRKKGIKFSDIDYKLYSNKKLAIRAAIIARNIQAFIICHELSHIIFDKDCSSDKFDKELNADEKGMSLYWELIRKMPSEYNLHIDYSRAPLIFFDLLDLVEYFQEIIFDKKEIDSLYPSGLIRKSSLLSKCIFCLENSIDNFFYLSFLDTIYEIKYHLFINQKEIKENIGRINCQDK